MPGNRKWVCVCDCQLNLPENQRKYVIKPIASILSGKSRSCGCILRERHENYTPNLKNREHNEYDLTTFDYGVGYIKDKDYKFLFDKEDFELINKYCWHVHQFGYLVTNPHGRGKKSPIRLHRYLLAAHGLLDLNDTKHVVDHINGNVFDNRKENLRVVTRSQNTINQRIRSDSTTGHKGIHFYKRVGKYTAYLNKDHKRIFLGYFSTLDEAVAAYEKASKEIFGEYARAEENLNNGCNKEIK